MEDLIKFLNSLNNHYKEMAVAFLIIFPIAYVDCWKLSESFKDLELFQQLLLCGGISMLMMLIGVIFSFWFVLVSLYPIQVKKNEINVLINVLGIVFPFAVTSTFVFLNSIRSREFFEIIYFGICAVSIGYSFLSNFISNKFKHRKSMQTTDNQISPDYINP